MLVFFGKVAAHMFFQFLCPVGNIERNADRVGDFLCFRFPAQAQLKKQAVYFISLLAQ